MHFGRLTPRIPIFVLILSGWIVVALSETTTAASQNPTSIPSLSPRAVLDKYCVTCHNQRLRTAGMTLDTLDFTNPAANAEMWERVILKLRLGSMPPQGNPRPDAETSHGLAVWLENEIDRAWLGSPNPGRIGAVHRLNRTEYNNA